MNRFLILVVSYFIRDLCPRKLLEHQLVGGVDLRQPHNRGIELIICNSRIIRKDRRCAITIRIAAEDNVCPSASRSKFQNTLCCDLVHTLAVDVKRGGLGIGIVDSDQMRHINSVRRALQRGIAIRTAGMNRKSIFTLVNCKIIAAALSGRPKALLTRR